jgi:hypothetical protein
MDLTYDREGKQGTRSQTGTFRIEQDMMIALRREAKQNKESINVVINRILRFYIDYHLPLSRAEYIYFSKRFLTRIFDLLTDEQISKIAQDFVKYEFKEDMQMIRSEDTLSSFLDALCRWLDESRFPYIHDNDEANDSDIYTIRFDMGTRYSSFSESILNLYVIISR